MYELPLKRGLEYYHCALWENGAWTIRPESKMASQNLSDLSKWIDTQVIQKRDVDLDLEAYE